MCLEGARAPMGNLNASELDRETSVVKESCLAGRERRSIQGAADAVIETVVADAFGRGDLGVCPLGGLTGAHE